MTPEIYNGIGKKLRASYLAGKSTADEVLRVYRKNKKEADAFDSFGLSFFDLRALAATTHNPLLRNKLNQLIEQFKHKSRCSYDQNKLSLQKLDFYHATALGMGVRGVIKELGKVFRTTGNVEAYMLSLMIQIEFANLVAKKRPDKKMFCYERKDLLLMRLSDWLYENNWKCGISYSTGKTASYLVFVYLPNGEQVSWHCNNYRIINYFEEEDFTWDGLPCTTLEKLLAYVHEAFGIGCELVRFDVAA